MRLIPGRTTERQKEKRGTVPIRYDGEDSVGYILGTFYLSVDLNPFKTKLKTSCLTVVGFFFQTKI